MKLYLNDADGNPYGRFSRLEPDLAQSPMMLMNGGMYHDDLSAVGLYVEQGQQQKGISTKAGWGNFHLLPNGVFWLKGGKVRVAGSQQKGIIYFFQNGDERTILVHDSLKNGFLLGGIHW